METFRLNKVARDFNVGIKTLVEYLAKKGHQVSASPNTKISKVQYELLATAFDSERKVKEEADNIELMPVGSNRVVKATALQHNRKEKELLTQGKRSRPKRIFLNSENTNTWRPTQKYQGLDSQNTRKEYGSPVRPVRIGRG